MYLEDNKTKKFIDVEGMTQTLYDTYPEYRRKKYKVFQIVLHAVCVLSDEICAVLSDFQKEKQCYKLFFNMGVKLVNIKGKKKMP